MERFVRVLTDNLPFLLAGLGTTLQLAAISLGLALVLGAVGAVLRTVPIRPLRFIGTVYVEFVRNTPLLVQMFFMYFGLPSIGIRLPEFSAAFLALGIYTGAFVTEALRAGILAVHRGHIEAARSLGLSYVQTLRLVTLPQAVATSIPPLGSLASALVRNTSVASAIAVGELLYNAEVVNSRTFATYEVFAIVGVLYLMVTLPLGGGVAWVERYFGRYRAA